MNRTYRTVLGLLLSAAVAVSANPAVPPEEVVSAVEKVAPTIKEVSTKVWEFSELSLFEVKSSEYLKDVLKKNGFEIISEGTANVPTAFVTEYGHGKPVLGIMLEYDAMPGLGNEPVPVKEPRKDGVTAGHGCGHNLIGSGALGAAVAIKNLMQEKDIPGTLRIYGGAAAAAKVLALTGMDILTDEKLRKEMKADFDRRTEGFVYKSPINEMIKEPVGLPDDMRHFETLLELKESIIKTAEDDQLKPGSDK